MTAPSGFPEFRHVTVVRPNGRMLGVHWSLKPHAWPVEDLVFILFRSNGPEGPWEEVGVAEPGRHDFTDLGVVGAGVVRTYYYIVRCASRRGDGYVDAHPRRTEHDPDHIALDMIRKKNLFMTVRTKVAGAVLPRKSQGAKCSRCYNYERGLPDDPDCPDCYGTGFAGGYLNPVLVPSLLNPPRRAIMDAGIKYEPWQVYVEIANWPILNPKDLYVDRQGGIRYTVEQVTPTSHGMHVVSQVAMLLRVDENAAVYGIEVPAAPHQVEARAWDLLTRGEPDELLRHTSERP